MLESMVGGSLKSGPRQGKPWWLVGVPGRRSLEMGPSVAGALLVCWVWREERCWSPWQDGSGEPIVVEGVLGSQVACDEPVGCLDDDDLLGGLGQHCCDCGMSFVEGV